MVALIMGEYSCIAHSFPSVIAASSIVNHLKNYCSLSPTPDGVRACQSKIRDAYLTVSAMHDVDIPSHVVEIERGIGKEKQWLHFLPLEPPLCNAAFHIGQQCHYLMLDLLR